MSVIGKGSLSIKKTEVKEQKNVALGFKKVKFAHQASAGQTGFNLGTLVTPTDMSVLGFVQPSSATLLRGNLFTFRNNLKLVSSVRGLLIDQLSYTVASSSQITFQGFTALEGEIFVGHFDEAPTTSLSVVDGRTVVASGILLAGQTDFNIGTPMPINQNPLANVGAVMVFVDRGLQYRKTGNVIAGDGDYIEVPVAGGLGSLIRFAASAVDRYVMVMSNGVVAVRADGSMMAAVERVQGQIDAMVPVLSAAAGVPTTTFQTAPGNVDLKQFGDQVSTNTNAIATTNSNLSALAAVAVTGGSGVTGSPRLETVYIMNGVASQASNGGSWISSVVKNTTGDYTINLVPGSFSSFLCFTTSYTDNPNGNTVFGSSIYTVTSTSVRIMQRLTQLGNTTASDIGGLNVMFIGVR